MQAVDVVNLEHQCLASPERPEATRLALVSATQLEQRLSDSIDSDCWQRGITHYKTLIRRYSSGPSAMLGTTVRPSTEQV
jgi:hypothetical protein